MMSDLEQMIKEKLLEELISKMSDAGGDRLRPKGMGVEVQAPDKEKLAEGLDKAKDLVSKDDVPDLGHDEHSSDEDDEQRLLQLLEEDDDDKEY